MSARQFGASIEGGATLEHEAWLTVNRGPTTFVVSISFDDVQNTLWGAEYLLQPKTHEAKASNMILTLCMPIIEKLASTSSIQGLRLEALCDSSTYRLRIANAGGAQGEDIHVVVDEDTSHGPSHGLLPMPISELAESCTGVARIPATDVTLSTADEQLDVHNAEFPHGKAFMEDGTAVYLKSSLGGTQFERELETLGRIEQLGLRNSDSNRFSRLIAVVTTGEQNEKVVGMLLELIPTVPHGGDLLHEAMQARTDMHQKWKSQVLRMVEELHAHDIVWGDVNAGNVVIDNDLNAWVIDFGGMNNAEFVDDELAETIEGDWQGVRRLFDEWLPSRGPNSQP
ncbi:hypothetical protein LTR86_007498 [Recurvomyces mirabilis]|nr:hypothetical protein LTR86_007498 [Recurvomyces mirabilis]